jgi:hypothetical protein
MPSLPAAMGVTSGTLQEKRLLALVPAPQRRKAQLDRLEGVRREMSRVYRDMESGKRDSQDGSRLVYVLTQIAKVLELTEIERRLDLLQFDQRTKQRTRRASRPRSFRVPRLRHRC